MPEVGGADCVQAWLHGVELLAGNKGSCANLITRIESPHLLQEKWLCELSPNKINRNGDDIRSVINTVFPYKLWARSGSRAELYQRYASLISRAGTKGTWGTYFGRLTSFGEKRINQLENTIEKLSTWPTRSQTGLYMHLSSSETDSLRTRGAPCWQYGQFKWNADETIDLTVVYRNHDFFNKALGNFLSLGQLMKFVAVEARKSPGNLICHSIHAYYDCKRDITSLAAKLND